MTKELTINADPSGGAGVGALAGDGGDHGGAGDSAPALALLDAATPGALDGVGVEALGVSVLVEGASEEGPLGLPGDLLGRDGEDTGHGREETDNSRCLHVACLCCAVIG